MKDSKGVEYKGLGKEIEYKGFMIVISENPDKKIGGEVWVVSKNNETVFSGIGYGAENALDDAIDHIEWQKK